jgi:hypothetical protein
MVGRYMIRRRRPPSRGRKTFLRNHIDGIAALDLFVVKSRSRCSRFRSRARTALTWQRGVKAQVAALIDRHRLYWGIIIGLFSYPLASSISSALKLDDVLLPAKKKDDPVDQPPR